ncbi:MAG TPA: LysR substrate-binding domain-containing protein [Pseudonocardia sp.]|uniref:LysR substrate-binding domain-containing protein n=1 Tax=Pseudonocardia sp. TaxID=60912 RepID=UPI002B4B1517|nr:LysR substrate-binding domain-containing protein [Pseudonocardia sp.]HLU58643.1 LysR substrate-binding domain-containing protein [Pseudonocardia sp.]
MDGNGAPMQLPPLNALRSFEAAGRLGSIRAAAAELVVTPGAVSRQVRVLESWLGVQLFRHEGRSIQLTEVGARYLEATSHHLSSIAKATGQVTGRWRGEETLQLRSFTLFASNWLVPRLARFHRSQPWVELELVTSSRPEDFGNLDVDAELRPNSHLPDEGFDLDLVVSDVVVLVCSPQYQDEYRLDEPDDLRRVPSDGFLRSVASPQLWQNWLRCTGITGVDATRGPRYSDTTLTYRAAVSGQGVALAPRSFVEPEIASGSLVVPFDAPGQQLDFYLLHPSHRPRRRAFTAFRDWLLAEAGTRKPRSAPESADPAGAA